MRPNTKAVPASTRPLALALAAMLPWGGASAMTLDLGNRDFQAVWTNTVKYSAAWRVAKIDDDVSGSNYNPNIDGGDHNFGRGLISNRLDVLTELDLRYKRNFGIRLSAAAWYDDVYQDETDSSLAIPNALSTPNGEFTDDTSDLHGQETDLLDSFAFARFKAGGMRMNFKIGQFTQLYGESLFFGANGIAAAQVTPDIVKLLSVPNSQFKEILRPVEQMAFNVQVDSNLSVGLYYQFEWEQARLPASGSYFSFADFVDDGGEVVFFPDIFTGTAAPLLMLREHDIEADDSGQGGIQVKLRTELAEFGLYASVHHDKTPQFYFRPQPLANGPGSYALVYAEDIETYGISASTLIGETNVAGELSFRHNSPLLATGNVVLDFAGIGDGDKNALYPVGNTQHLNLSAITLFNESLLWDGATFVGEFAFNRRGGIDKNADQLDPRATRSASAIRFTFEPEYFQVVPGVDLKVPVGLGYGINGRSSVLGAGAMPPTDGGDISVGLKADMRKVWQAAISYTHYFGTESGVVNAVGGLSYEQMHRDRDFVSLSVQRAF